MDDNTNTVYLVGAGPGDPDLLTVKALRLIQKADVVIYDRLVSDPILDLVSPEAERIFAGKRARDHYMPQDEINGLLVESAISGKIVVRLKGGDPFVFGRGGEEAVTLAEAGVRFEIVPGITSSAGCAAYAGIPLTHRDHAHSVRFVTGHTQHGDEPELNWSSLADPATTLVVYMGMTNAPIISTKLIEAGLDASTPAAAINMGTRPEQKVVLSTLSGLPQAIVDNALSGATLLVIGSVVNLADTIAWFAPET